jgi:hypothetical protein
LPRFSTSAHNATKPTKLIKKGLGDSDDDGEDVADLEIQVPTARVKRVTA